MKILHVVASLSTSIPPIAVFMRTGASADANMNYSP